MNGHTSDWEITFKGKLPSITRNYTLFLVYDSAAYYLYSM